MTLIAGLGNPGKQYELNRHNIGFMTVDFLVDKLSAKDVTKSSFFGTLYKKDDILLLKPTTFMNLSGKSIVSVKNFYKPTKVIVIHDDLDLAFGALKFKFGGSNAGHNGLKSIDLLSSKEYFRVRMGIGKPLYKSEVSSYVLSNFTKSEQECLQELIKKAAAATMKLVNEPLELVSSKFSQKKC